MRQAAQGSWEPKMSVVDGMIPLRYGLKSKLTISRAAIETKDEHCDRDTNNRMANTHKHTHAQIQASKRFQVYMAKQKWWQQ